MNLTFYLLWLHVTIAFGVWLKIIEGEDDNLLTLLGYAGMALMFWPVCFGYWIAKASAGSGVQPYSRKG